MIKYVTKPTFSGKKLSAYDCKPGNTFISVIGGTNLVLILGDFRGLSILDAYAEPMKLSEYGLDYLPCDVSLEIVR